MQIGRETLRYLPSADLQVLVLHLKITTIVFISVLFFSEFCLFLFKVSLLGSLDYLFFKFFFLYFIISSYYFNYILHFNCWFVRDRRLMRK